jgi:hypothetical protein
LFAIFFRFMQSPPALSATLTKSSSEDIINTLLKKYSVSYVQMTKDDFGSKLIMVPLCMNWYFTCGDIYQLFLHAPSKSS